MEEKSKRASKTEKQRGETVITEEKVISWTVGFIPANNSELMAELKDVIRRLEKMVEELEN